MNKMKDNYNSYSEEEEEEEEEEEYDDDEDSYYSERETRSSSLIGTNSSSGLINGTSNRRKQSKPIRLDQQQQQQQQQQNKEKLNDDNPSTLSSFESSESSNKHSTSINSTNTPTISTTTSQKPHLNYTFCYICKKEVCNKYFLKTHLANKHSLVFDDEQLQTYLLEKQQDFKENINYDNDSSLLTLNQIKHEQQTSLSNSSSTKYEDFCELCQKQFCNKYYLKKHKLDVHGIKMNYTSKSNNNNNNKIDSSNTSTTSSNDLTTTAAAAAAAVAILNPFIQDTKLLTSILSPQSIENQSKLNEILLTKIESKEEEIVKVVEDVKTNETVSCDLCNKIFYNKEYLQLHIKNKHSINKENNNTNRQLVNRDTHCEFCNKTFCNKYFLKTHIARIHNRPHDPNDTDKVYCDICNKSVCNKYFLKTHKLKIHGIDSTNSSSLPTLVKSSDKASLSDDIQVEEDYDEEEEEEEEEGEEHHQQEKSDYEDGEEADGNFKEFNLNGKRNKRISSIESNNSKKIKLNDDSDLSIQPFFIESNDNLFNSLFKPCMIYLPVKCKLNKSISLNLTLKPLEKN